MECRGEVGHRHQNKGSSDRGGSEEGLSDQVASLWLGLGAAWCLGKVLKENEGKLLNYSKAS